MNCQKCGAECPPGTSFCRQCGAPVDTGAIRASEQTTALLEQDDGVTTQRLESRATGPEYGRLPRPVEAPVAGKHASNRRALLIAALAVVVVCVIGIVGFKALNNRRGSMSQFVYPGAKVLLDLKMEDGGGALQLETSDSFDAVESWYEKTLNSQKVVRLTPTNVVLKNDKALVTIAGDGNKTHVVIKTFK